MTALDERPVTRTYTAQDVTVEAAYDLPASVNVVLVVPDGGYAPIARVHRCDDAECGTCSWTSHHPVTMFYGDRLSGTVAELQGLLIHAGLSGHEGNDYAGSIDDEDLRPRVLWAVYSNPVDGIPVQSGPPIEGAEWAYRTAA